MYFNVYVIPLAAAAIIMILVSILIQNNRQTPGGKWFSMLMIAGAWYSLFYSLEISSVSIEYVRIFYKLQYAGIPLIPVFFLLFAASYTRGRDHVKPGLIGALLVIPVITALMAFTSDYHDVFITDGSIEDDGVFPSFIFSPGPWYWVHNIYSITVILISIVLLARMWAKTAPVFRIQTGMVLAGSVIPFMFYIIYLTGFFPAGLDPNPFSFAITGILVFLGIAKYKLFSLSPVARDILFDNIPDGVAVIDSFLRLVDLNSSASDILAVNPDNVGKPAGEVLAGWPEILACLTGDESEDKFEISRIGDERALFLECRLISLSDEFGLGRGRMLLIRDVTDRKRAELDKHVSEEKFETIFDHAPLGLMHYDKNGIVELCNGYFLNLLGTNEEKVTGLSILRLPDRRIVETVKTSLEGKRAQFEGEYTSLTGNKTVNVRAVFEPLVSRSGKVEGGLCIVEDVTDSKLAENRIKRNNAELKRLNAEKDRFFSILAHDLRSPFSSFLGFTDILEEGVDTMPRETIHTIVGSLKESANNLYGLLENLLQWSRMKQGTMDYHPEKLNIRESILSSIEPLLSFANNKIIAVSYDMPEELFVCADRKMLDTVIRNLFTNAVKFTNREGSISIQANTGTDGWVKISFRDTGIGMSKEMVRDLFRIDVKTSRPGTDGELSTGLGLILCKEFVTINGGSIAVESKVGKGSCFSFTLRDDCSEN